MLAETTWSTTRQPFTTTCSWHVLVRLAPDARVGAINPTLHLVLRLHDSMQISVKMLTGKTIGIHPASSYFVISVGFFVFHPAPTLQVQ